MEVSPYADVPAIDGVPTPVIAAGGNWFRAHLQRYSPLAVSSIKKDKCSDSQKLQPAPGDAPHADTALSSL